jgi:hypothetical protein
MTLFPDWVNENLVNETGHVYYIGSKHFQGPKNLTAEEAKGNFDGFTSERRTPFR